MGAHRRRIIRQRSTASSRRRGTKSSDASASSLGGQEDTSSCGSWPDTEESTDFSSTFAPGTLIRRPSVARSGGGWTGRAGSSGAGIADGGAGDQPMYHPEAECSQLEGFAWRLSSSHEAALGGLRQWLTREAVDLTPLVGDGETCPPEEEDLALLRFLRQNDWDVELTRAQVEATLSWRVEARIAADKRREPWDVSGCASEEKFEQLCRTQYPHYTLGTDRLGRPVLVQKYGDFDTSKLQECTTMKGLLRYHAWEQEKNAELLRRATSRTGYLVETYAVIMDFKGMSMGQVNRDFLWLLRELAEIDRRHYPGRGGVIYVINTPALFGLVWQGIRGFLSTQARVHFFGKESEWKPALAEAIDPCILPPEYGGTAPPLADTPLLPAVQCALGRDAAPTKLNAEAPGENPSSEGKDGVAARPMSSLLRRFSLGGGDGSCLSEGDTSSLTSSVSGDYGGGGGGSGSGGGSPFVVSRGFRSSGVGFKSSGVARGGGDGLFSASTNGKAQGARGRGGGDIACKDPPTQAGVVCGGVNAADASSSKNGARPQGWPSRGAAANGKPNPSPPLRSVTLRAPPLEAAPSVVALPASDDPRTSSASPPPPPFSSSSSCSHVVIVGQQHGDAEGSNNDNDGGEEEEEEANRGDLEWVLDVVPGARLAATVAGTVAGATLGFAAGAAGFAAGVAEAVIPGHVWAEGVHAFQSAQFVGGWVLGR